jgi:hypothetical protein
MTDIGAPRDGEVESALDAIVLESPVRLPGPGIWAAWGWTLLLVVALNGVGIALTLALVVAGAELDDAMLVLLPVSSLTVVLLSLALTVGLFGRRVGRVLGWRAPTAWQVVLTILLVAPLGTVVQEI